MTFDVSQKANGISKSVGHVGGRGNARETHRWGTSGTTHTWFIVLCVFWGRGSGAGIVAIGIDQLYEPRRAVTNAVDESQITPISSELGCRVQGSSCSLQPVANKSPLNQGRLTLALIQSEETLMEDSAICSGTSTVTSEWEMLPLALHPHRPQLSPAPTE